MMIIQFNGKVPGLTDQEVFDGAIDARNKISEFQKKFKGKSSESTRGKNDN